MFVGEYLKHRKHPTSELALQTCTVDLNDLLITKPEKTKKTDINETLTNETTTSSIPLKRSIDALEDEISVHEQSDGQSMIESVSTQTKATLELQLSHAEHEQLRENTQMHETQDTVQNDAVPEQREDVIKKQTSHSPSASAEKELRDVESLTYAQTIDNQMVRDSMLDTRDELTKQQLEDEEMMELTHLKPDELKEMEQLETEQAEEIEIEVEQTEMQLETDNMQAKQAEIQLEIERKETEIMETEQLETESTGTEQIGEEAVEETKDELVRDDAQSGFDDVYGYDGMELLNNDALANEQPIASPVSKLSEGIDDLALLGDKASEIDAHKERLDEVIDELKSSIRSNYQSKAMKLRDIQAEVLDSVIVKVIKDEK